MEKNTYRFGVDVGGTNIQIALIDDAHRIIDKTEFHSGSAQDRKEAADKMLAIFREMMTAHDIKEHPPVGIGSPGMIDAVRGVVVYSNNMPKWTGAAITNYLAERTGAVVKLANDADSAALGEFLAGAGKTYRSMVLLTLGTGVGGGVVHDGKLFTGGQGGIELGHISLYAGGIPCTCGRKGCVESYCSATALIREGTQAVKAGKSPALTKLYEAKEQQLEAKDIFDAADAGDPTAKQIEAKYLSDLAEAIANQINIFRPDVIVLSGGISNRGQKLVAPLEKLVPKIAYAADFVGTPPIVIAELGNDAGIIGAAGLVY